MFRTHLGQAKKKNTSPAPRQTGHREEAFRLVHDVVGDPKHGVRSSLLPHFRAIEEKPLGSENNTDRRLGKPDHHEPRARTPPVAASRPSSPSDSTRALSLLRRTPPEKAQTSRTRMPPTPQITAKVAAGRRTPSTVFWATSEISRRQRNWPPLSSPEFASSSAPSTPFSSLPIRESFSQMPNVSSNTTVDVEDKSIFPSFFLILFYLLVSLVLIDSFDVLSTGVGNYECVLSAYECECE
ncbi:hypothetical protein LR48_Vigan522s000100 [Vigna angularis]|uniref:Uncharacterized protein n=1 Tax=Phaseolus angularis TaxID=3914 RepID=A0A0L9TDT8_PHAAN|nr:hypothetical protein LR48_Vigan522s000100 [Vigna angularis]